VTQRKKRKIKHPYSLLKQFIKKNKNTDFGKLIVGLFIALLLFVGYFVYDLPDIENVKPLDTRPHIVVLANDGSKIASYGDNKSKNVELKDVPQHLIEAVLSIEDRRFYHHFGIDPIGIARAMVANVRAGHFVQGGSTITQQLTKNLFLTPDKTLRRKIQEALMALQIEFKYTKNEILSAYLNRVYFGAGAYGVDSAAHTYFNKDLKNITLWESAILAGLLKAPSRYSPATNPELAKERAQSVIESMKEAGYINKNSKVAVTETIRPNIASYNKALNNYFADWIINQIDSFVTTSDGGIIVKTTLSPKLQLLAEKNLVDLHNKISKSERVGQMALVTQAHDGAVLAMIGGADYKRSEFNRATQARRQPGSVFKPFVYLAALENGFKPDDEIMDEPINENGYRPENYDGRYYGKISLQKALQRSLNSATINLLKEVGFESLISVVERAGLDITINHELSAALGTNEVSLLSITNAYNIFSNGGKAVWPYAILSIENGNGEVLYQRTPFEYQQVFSSDNTERLNYMLEKVIDEEGTGYGAKYRTNSRLAGKTGTTQNYRDAWFIGFNDKYTTGVWMGNDDNSPTNRIAGGKYPAMLWRDYMMQASYLNVPEFVQQDLLSYEGGNYSEPEKDVSEGVSEGVNNFIDMIGKWAKTPPQPTSAKDFND